MKNYPGTLIDIQPLNSSDVAYVAALQPEGWGDILSSIRFYCASEFCHPLKAIIGNKLVGIGTAIVHDSTAWLAHIIVHKEFRNAGIGTTITRSLIDLVRKTSCETILLIATALGEPVYRNLGFVTETQYVFFDHGTLPEPSNDGNIVPFQAKYKDALLEYDHSISGEYRKKLFEDHLPDTKIVLEDNGLRGFYMPTLGEGLIISGDPQEGLELMKHKRNKMFCLPVNNAFGIDFLERHGYKRIREASRMILGKKINWNPQHVYSRIGGNLG